MRILSQIPFEPDEQVLMRTAHIEPDSDDARAFHDLVRLARDKAHPKAIYHECFIEDKGEDTVRIQGIAFQSLALRKNLDSVEKVYPHIATCGHEMDAVERPPDDPLMDYWWDTLKTAVLGAAIKALNAEVVEKHRLGKTAVMHPGSGDVQVWPIEEQKKLFSLFGDVQALIGVRLTDSCLMIPNKTVSGILFSAEHDFRTCQVCHREHCPSRSAEFDPALWESIQGH